MSLRGGVHEPMACARRGDMTGLMQGPLFIRRALAAVAGAAALAGVASAQLAVTTFGTSAARGCYLDAGDGVTRDTERCDKALDGPLSERDAVATLVNRGVVLNRAGRYEDAVRDFNAALSRDPSVPEAMLNRGNARLLQNRPDEAVADYEASLAAGLAEAHVAWHNIGLAWYAKANLIRARAAFRKALEIRPGFPDSLAKLEELEGKRGENDQP